MKRFTAFILAALMTLSLAACGGSGSSSSAAKEVDPAALADEMLEAISPQGEMMEVTGDVAANYYDLGEDVAAYKIYISTMYIGEEVAVLQVADSGSADAVKAACEKRIQDLKDSFDGYLPDEYAAVDANATVLSNGNIVAMVTGTADGVAAAKEVFEKAFQ